MGKTANMTNAFADPTSLVASEKLKDCIAIAKMPRMSQIVKLRTRLKVFLPPSFSSRKSKNAEEPYKYLKKRKSKLSTSMHSNKCLQGDDARKVFYLAVE